MSAKTRTIEDIEDSYMWFSIESNKDMHDNCDLNECHECTGD